MQSNQSTLVFHAQKDINRQASVNSKQFTFHSFQNTGLPVKTSGEHPNIHHIDSEAVYRHGSA